jgi:hypothetical protein
MNWFLQNWYWIAFGVGVVMYFLGRHRRVGESQAAEGTGHEGLVETDGDASNRPRPRRGCC